MKNFVGSLIIILTFTIPNVSLPQGEAAVPFLTVPVSPLLNGMGATGTSIPTDDPFDFLYNPAQLGYISKDNNFSFIIYPASVDISPFSFYQVDVNAFAFNIGYNFKKLINFPLTVGIGFSRPEINFGEFVITNEGGPEPQGTVESKDYFLALSLGAGIDYGVQFYSGITYKSITSILAPPDIGVGAEQTNYDGNASAYDFGLLLNVPVIKLIDDEADLDLFQTVPSIPFFNFSIGYSQLNIGDEIYYIDPAQADPLPRTARLGYGLSTGIDLKIDDMMLRTLELGFTVDAEDLLISGRFDTTGASSNGYQSFLGDIDIGRNIIQMKGDENVISRSGFKLDFVETLTITWGKYSGRSYDNLKTYGIAIRSKGLLKLLDKFTNDPTMSYIAKHFDIRYYNSTYNVDHWSERDFEGIALVINGYQLW
jgi:hypothetical protein